MKSLMLPVSTQIVPYSLANVYGDSFARVSGPDLRIGRYHIRPSLPATPKLLQNRGSSYLSLIL